MSRMQHIHILAAPVSEKQQEYAGLSHAGKLGSKVDENGVLLQQFMPKIESRFKDRVKPV